MKTKKIIAVLFVLNVLLAITFAFSGRPVRLFCFLGVAAISLGALTVACITWRKWEKDIWSILLLIAHAGILLCYLALYIYLTYFWDPLFPEK